LRPPSPPDALHCKGILSWQNIKELYVSAFNMRERDTRIFATLCTVGLLEDSSGTRLILTDQSVFFDGRETPTMRRSGWGQVLDRLKAHLGGDNATKI
jgi:Activator of Hsp90 ATPase homolog 1-like protein